MDKEILGFALIVGYFVIAILFHFVIAVSAGYSGQERGDDWFNDFMMCLFWGVLLPIFAIVQFSYTFSDIGVKIGKWLKRCEAPQLPRPDLTPLTTAPRNLFLWVLAFVWRNERGNKYIGNYWFYIRDDGEVLARGRR